MTSTCNQIVLASQSPRRRALLEQIGIRFSVRVADVDESQLAGEPVTDYVVRLAESKAAAVCTGLDSPVPVLGADTVVVVDGSALGKPSNRDDASNMLAQLSGRSHEVLTAVAVAAGRRKVVLNTTRVWFRDISVAERDAYVRTEEPMDKAGAYAIQGFAAVFVSRIDGSYSGVMGLPLYETAGLLAEFDVHPKNLD